MENVCVQLGCTTRNGAYIPIATSRNPALARLVARYMLGEISKRNFDDKVLNMLAEKEQNHFTQVMSSLGIEIENHVE